MFQSVDAHFLVSPQITIADIGKAAALGVKLVVNNRPEGESPDQTPGEDIAAAAAAAGMAYVAIPVTHSGFSHGQIDALQAALAESGDAPVLAYCRSGTRSTLLWALTMARGGMAPDDIAAKAAGAGYDIAPIRPTVDMLAAARSDR